MYFSAKYLRTNPLRLKQKLLKVYPVPALPHGNDRIIAIIPEAPYAAIVSDRNDTISLAWSKGYGTKNFIIYRFKIGRPAERTDPVNIFRITPDTLVRFRSGAKTALRKYYYVVTSQSKTNTESAPVYFTRQ
jgi:hypothetical protein